VEEGEGFLCRIEGEKCRRAAEEKKLTRSCPRKAQPPWRTWPGRTKKPCCGRGLRGGKKRYVVTEEGGEEIYHENGARKRENRFRVPKSLRIIMCSCQGEPHKAPRKWRLSEEKSR